ERLRAIRPLGPREVELGVPVTGIDAVHPEALPHRLVLQRQLCAGRNDGDVAVVRVEQFERLREAEPRLVPRDPGRAFGDDPVAVGQARHSRYAEELVETLTDP